MLRAGTIEFNVVTREWCEHFHTEDGWHPFRGDSLLPYLANVEDANFCNQLDFLVKHRFISASLRLHASAPRIFVRIYIIPYDLPNVDGKLLLRRDVVMKPASLYLRKLLPMIDNNPGKWEGNPIDFLPWRPPLQPFLSSEVDNRTMAEIYGDLPSPEIDASLELPSERITRRILSGDGPEGLLSDLYEYQQRSVVAMLQRENPKRRVGPPDDDYFVDMPDPLYIPIVGVDGQEYHLQPAKMVILHERPKVTATRGGILCEELGTGKTVMVLALILATLNDLPMPETLIHHRHPPIVMTPLAFRHFPGDFEGERRRILTSKNKVKFPQDSRVPSLVELLLHHLRVPRKGLQPVTLHKYQDELQDRDIYRSQIANTPFYHYEDAESFDDDRPKRKSSKLAPRVMFITSATLIVVPNTLLHQWYREIQKHCDVRFIRVLMLMGATVMPPANYLASNYDIILMTYHRFSAEAANKDVAKLHSRSICRCPAFGRSRVPDCKCGHTPGVSPLLQVRWKRLIIDEGHVSASLSTNLTPFARLLSIEHRWIVTGTPTTNLLGLSFGHSSELEAKDEDELEYEPDPDDPDSTSVNTSNSDEIVVARKWTKYDREDLRKLDNMATHFVGVPHFKAEPKVFYDNVTTALFGLQGSPLPGAIQVLNQVMQSVMIRHRIEDVEKDIVLPSIQQETILLDLDPYAVKAYNAMQAAIAINAVDSERRDMDYLFHPKNTDALRELVENMSQLMFWFVDANMYGVDQMLKNAPSNMEKAVERNISNDDMRLLRDAHAHVRLAAEDPLWRTIQTHEDVPYQVFHMIPRVLGAWSRTIASDYPLRSPPLVGLMHPDRLIKLRDLVLRRPLITEDRMVEWGHAVAAKDREQRRLYNESLEKNKQKSDHKETGNQSKAVRWAKRGARAEKVQEIRNELAKVLNKLEAFQEEDGRSTSHPATTAPETRPHFLPPSPLACVRIGSSCSTKLNYILNEVLQYAAEEKFLIFSKSPLSLAHVAEGLELIQVKYLQFTTQVVPQLREQFVMTFETSDTFRVFLMELKHGARGLNLVSASRVIFCEPVWQADVESQAIKRVHRIGQTKPVNVKTLAIRSTAEENMMARREALKGKDGRLPKLTEEVGMRHYIANPKFIDHKSTLLPTLDVSFIDIPTRVGHTEEGVVNVTMEEGLTPWPSPIKAQAVRKIGECQDTDTREEPLRKKTKPGVRFLD